MKLSPLIGLLCLVAPPAFGQAATATSAVVSHAGQTDCSRCHTPEGWRPARFDHGQVGWVLVGRHREATCRDCHLERLDAPVPTRCAGCHRDPHRGELGQRCEGCHQQLTWESRFDADAHRRTAFPLSGAHAAIPCEECHEDAMSRGFIRSGARCVRCHQADYDRAGLTSIDHVMAGFDTTCQRCHTPWRFDRARFDAHDRCFLISAGDHAGIGCRDCHTSLEGARITGQCRTFTAACTGCHEHRREETDPEHDDVPGYDYEDRKCYECHRFADDD